MRDNPIRVLVVDDDLSWRVRLSAVLHELGYAPTGVGSVDRALDRLDAGTADVVLADLHSGGHGGLDLLRQVREHGLPVPVVAMSAGDDDMLRRRAVELGAVDVLEKALDPDALAQALSVARVRLDAA